MAKRRHGDNAPKAIRFDPEDEQMLQACADAEKLSLSDTVRRAVRHYAKHLGVEPRTTKAA
jgi:hypothetical protein